MPSGALASRLCQNLGPGTPRRWDMKGECRAVTCKNRDPGCVQDHVLKARWRFSGGSLDWRFGFEPLVLVGEWETALHHHHSTDSLQTSKSEFVASRVCVRRLRHAAGRCPAGQGLERPAARQPARLPEEGMGPGGGCVVGFL